MSQLTQGAKFIKALKHAGNKGKTNWELSRIAIKYTSVISDLRKSGYNIYAERQYLKNGSASNTWRYYLIEEDDPRVSEINQNKPLAV